MREGGREEGGSEGGREGGGSEGRRGEGLRKGEGVRKGERMVGSAGPSSWFVGGGGGGRSSPFVVVGPRCVFVVLVHCSQPLDLPWSFLSQRDVAADWRGRGDVEDASRQLPVGGQQWWCHVSGVGGNRRAGFAYLSVIKLKGVVVVVVPRRSVLHGYHVAFSDVARLTRGVIRGSGAVECSFCRRWLSCAARRPGCRRC